MTFIRRISNPTIIATNQEPMWQQLNVDQNLIQQENNPFMVSFKPVVQKKDDES